MISQAAHFLLIWGQKSGDVDRKRAFFDEAKVLFAQVGDQDGQARSKNYLALTYFPGDLAESRRLFLEAKKDFASLSMPNWGLWNCKTRISPKHYYIIGRQHRFSETLGTRKKRMPSHRR
jgi:hypothetical protein